MATFGHGDLEVLTTIPFLTPFFTVKLYFQPKGVGALG